jgi:hypothetical protein
MDLGEVRWGDVGWIGLGTDGSLGTGGERL